MKFKVDRKYIGWGITAFLVIVASILAIMIFNASESINNFFSTIIGAISPVLLGFAFAYILNPLLKILEFPIFKKWGEKLFANSEFKTRKAKTFSRAIALLLTVLVAIAFFVLLLWLIIPRLIESISVMISNLPTYKASIESAINDIFSFNDSMRQSVLNAFNTASIDFQNYLSNQLLTDLSNYSSDILNGFVEFIKAFFNVIVAFIISIYCLASKEKFSAQIKKLVYSIFETRRGTSIIRKTKKVDKIFTGFISGKVIDSLIIGIATFFILTITNLIIEIPYKELIAVFIGVTNVIPFFGPFIGAIPSAFLILATGSPLSCLVFLIIILLIQQIDGNVIQPKIVGESTGLSGFWVLVSLLVFGSLFGFIGMLIGVPTFAAIYAAIKSFVSDKLDEKKITNETDDFRDIDYIDPDTNMPVMKPTEEEIEEQKRLEREAEKAKKAEKKEKIKALTENINYKEKK